MTNAVLHVDSHPHYEIRTADKSNKTEIWDTKAERLVSSIKYRDILANTVKFLDLNDGKSLKISTWLKSAKLENGL